MVDMKQEFLTRFGGNEADVHLYFAPGRVNMIGEHTDYNGGHVFPCALTLGTYAAARKRDDRTVKLASLNIRSAPLVGFPLDDPDLLAGKASNGVSGEGWANYPKGVIRAFAERLHAVPGEAEEGAEKAGFEMLPSGIEILFYGDIPAGSGLSSSASLEVLTGLVLREEFGFDSITQEDLAFLGQQAENAYVGMNCGIMDQFASAMGKKDHAIFLDVGTMNYSYAPLVLKDAKIVITNSKVKHSLAGSAYNVRRMECEKAVELINGARREAGKPEIKALGELSSGEFETYADLLKGARDAETAAKENISEEETGDILYKRAHHAVYENERTLEAVDALKSGDIEKFGKLMNASHVSLRDDYAVSCPEVDELVDLAWSVEGTVGSRITGGGFGGCTVSIVKNDAIEHFKETVAAAYKKSTGKDAEFYVVEPGEGAHVL